MISLSIFLAACSAPENVQEADFTGTVVIPAAAATRSVFVDSGEVDTRGDTIFTETQVEDPRNIGPIFVGVFSSIDTTSFSYPHPGMGPVVSGYNSGDTYPYGGTTVGRYDFACYEMLACGVSTGRFKDYDDLLDYYKNTLLNPVTQDGEEVTSGAAFQQACFDYYFATSDAEMAFIGDLDFAKNADGNYEAEFTLNHTLGVDGAVVWGWMDAPVINSKSPKELNPGFTTCSPTLGRDYEEYNHKFQEGAPYYDLLNHPNEYITEGDWVGDGLTKLSVSADGNQLDDLVLNINTAVDQ